MREISSEDDRRELQWPPLSKELGWVCLHPQVHPWPFHKCPHKVAARLGGRQLGSEKINDDGLALGVREEKPPPSLLPPTKQTPTEPTLYPIFMAVYPSFSLLDAGEVLQLQ